MKKVILLWFIVILMSMSIGLVGFITVPNMAIFWAIFNFGFAQMLFILLFWGFAWVLGTTGNPKKRKFFTEVPAGKFCLVTRGSELVRVLINVAGHTVKSTDRDPFEIIEGEDLRGFWDTLSSMVGVRCISMLPFSRLHKKISEWNDEGREKPNDKIMEFIPRTEEIVFFSFQKNYGFETCGVETGSGKKTTLVGGAPVQSERIPVDVKNLVQVRIYDIYRALFLNDWVKLDGALIDETVIGFVGSNSLDTLIGQKPEDIKGIADAIVARNAELRKRTGVINASCLYKGYDYSGIGKERLQAASTERWEKENKAKGDAALIEEPGMAKVRVAKAANDPLKERVTILKDAGVGIAAAIAYADNTTVRTFAPGSGGMGLIVKEDEGGGK